MNTLKHYDDTENFILGKDETPTSEFGLIRYGNDCIGKRGLAGVMVLNMFMR
ncbi:hypothetical protein LJC57_07360 [Parabacteroides sp. OttesenSCG-928-G07]|nr:hypothetical protein [Parabacteroides sp. OttesenSCG-928-G07]